MVQFFTALLLGLLTILDPCTLMTSITAISYIDEEINNRRKVLDGKGRISREAAAKKVGAIYEEFRKKQDEAYISEFDRQTEKYLKGE